MTPNPHGTIDYRQQYHLLPERFRQVDYYLRVRRHWRLFPPTTRSAR